MVSKSYGNSIIKMDTQGISSKKLEPNELSFCADSTDPELIPYKPFTRNVFSDKERDELKSMIREVLMEIENLRWKRKPLTSE